MSSDPPPLGSILAPDTFLIIVQTPYQKEMFHKLGNTFMGIDATHNTTHYENVSLFTLMTRDRWGHGEEHIAALLPVLTHDQACRLHG